MAKSQNELTDEQRTIWATFQRMSQLVHSGVERDLQRSGLSGSDYAVLVMLSEAPVDGVAVSRLGRALDWEPSRLSHHLGRMERRGLITRRARGAGRHGAQMLLTEEGLAVLEAAAPSHAGTVRRLFVEPLGEEQLRALGEASAVLLAALTDDDQASCG
ncbi:MarR family transcriptional regulator [Streptomyces sp. NPDC051985]|uniref:MarR family winged helix-turn-helix transcriptional regulator n=1 Tax=Streptomyces sp. NPDC051985 TaxID=3155807 RepID=UPI0034463CB2